MTEPAGYGIALMAGFLIGLFYFGGLCRTIAVGMNRKHVELVFISSFLIRSGLSLMGIWLITRGEPIRVLAAMMGFTAARALLTASPAICRAFEGRREDDDHHP